MNELKQMPRANTARQERQEVVPFWQTVETEAPNAAMKALARGCSERSVSLRELARRCGRHYVSVRKNFSSRRPSAKTVEMIARAIGYDGSLDLLLGRRSVHELFLDDLAIQAEGSENRKRLYALMSNNIELCSLDLNYVLDLAFDRIVENTDAGIDVRKHIELYIGTLRTLGQINEKLTSALCDLTKATGAAVEEMRSLENVA